MTREQAKVRQFMKTFGQAVPETVGVPDEKTRILRVKLLLEEVLEFADASGVEITSEIPKGEKVTKGNLYMNVSKDADLVGIADGLADIDYVMQGAAVAYGLDLEPFCDEVHSSNMTKLWKLEEVSGTPALDITRVPDKGDGRVCIVRNESGKILKSPSYRPADLKTILDEQSNPNRAQPLTVKVCRTVRL